MNNKGAPKKKEENLRTVQFITRLTPKETKQAGGKEKVYEALNKFANQFKIHD